MGAWLAACHPVLCQPRIADPPVAASSCANLRVQTLFARLLPLPSVLFVWDGFLLYGTAFLYRAALGLLYGLTLRITGASAGVDRPGTGHAEPARVDGAHSNVGRDGSDGVRPTAPRSSLGGGDTEPGTAIDFSGVRSEELLATLTQGTASDGTPVWLDTVHDGASLRALIMATRVPDEARAPVHGRLRLVVSHFDCGGVCRAWSQVVAMIRGLDQGEVPTVPKYGNDVAVDADDVFRALESVF